MTAVANITTLTRLQNTTLPKIVSALVLSIPENLTCAGLTNYNIPRVNWELLKTASNWNEIHFRWWRRSYPLYPCYISITNNQSEQKITTGFNFFENFYWRHVDNTSSYTNFFKSLSESTNIICDVYTNKFTRVDYGKVWEDILLIYDSNVGLDILLSVYSNRLRLENHRNEFNVTIQFYVTYFQTVFNTYIDEDLGALEQSGILERLRKQNKMFRVLWWICREERFMRLKERQWINFYTAVHQPKSLISQFSKRDEDKWEPTKLESILVVFLLFWSMIAVCGVRFLWELKEIRELLARSEFRQVSIKL